MTQYDVLLAARAEYMEQLNQCMIPVLSDTFQTLYKKATSDFHSNDPWEYIQRRFQEYVRQVSTWSSKLIHAHLFDIKQKCDYVESLIHSIMLSQCKILLSIKDGDTDGTENQLHIPDTNTIVHAIFTATARIVWKHTYLYLVKNKHVVQKQKQHEELHTLYRKGVEQGLRNSLPFSTIVGIVTKNAVTSPNSTAIPPLPKKSMIDKSNVVEDIEQTELKNDNKNDKDSISGPQSPPITSVKPSSPKVEPVKHDITTSPPDDINMNHKEETPKSILKSTDAEPLVENNDNKQEEEQKDQSVPSVLDMRTFPHEESKETSATIEIVPNETYSNGTVRFQEVDEVLDGNNSIHVEHHPKDDSTIEKYWETKAKEEALAEEDDEDMTPLRISGDETELSLDDSLVIETLD